MRQVARVLRTGGLFFLTVPYGQRYGEERWMPGSDETRRRYDEHALTTRLSAPGLRCERRIYYGERLLPVDSLFTRYYVPAVAAMINWTSPVLQPLCWVECDKSRGRGVGLLYRKLPPENPEN
jgi:hypothetical protein